MRTCFTSEGKGSLRCFTVTPSKLPVAATRQGEPAKKRRLFNAFSQSCTSSSKMRELSGLRGFRLYSEIRATIPSMSSVGTSKIAEARSRSVWKSSFTKPSP